MTIHIFGCKIYISLLFLAMLAVMLFFDTSGTVLLGLAAVLIHECGHLTVMGALKSLPREIVLQPAGIEIGAPTGLRSYHDELLIAMAGCTANLLAAVAALCLYEADSMRVSCLWFSAANASVCAFNGIPMRGLDGGDILRLVLLKFFSEQTADRTVLVTSVLSVTLMLGLGAYLCIRQAGNIALLASGLYFAVLLFLNIRS